MGYRPRSIEGPLRRLTAKFSAVLVTGPRQAGKTSLLSHLSAELFGDRTSTVAFDTPRQVGAFRRDPALFFANHPGVLFLDEVQQVPDVFPYLKSEIDRGPKQFRFFLSGSQHFPLMRGVTESLAGRVAVLDLWPFAVQEVHAADPAETINLLEDPDQLRPLLGREFPANDPQDIAPAMRRGGFPVPLLEDAGSDWFEAYRRTYLQRDVRELSQVADLGKFDRFLVLLAGRSGTVINKSELGNVTGIDDGTVERWLSLLETSYQAFRLPPYTENATKRLVRRPKWIFADSGLGLHLQAIESDAALLNAPHFGKLFESFVLAEVRKLYGHAARAWNGFFWRTSQGFECDLVLHAGAQLIPFEVKHAATPRGRDLRGVEMFLDAYPKQARFGCVISMNPRVEMLSRRVFNVPVGLLLGGPRSAHGF